MSTALVRLNGPLLSGADSFVAGGPVFKSVSYYCEVEFSDSVAKGDGAPIRDNRLLFLCVLILLQTCPMLVVCSPDDEWHSLQC